MLNCYSRVKANGTPFGVSDWDGTVLGRGQTGGEQSTTEATSTQLSGRKIDTLKNSQARWQWIYLVLLLRDKDSAIAQGALC